MASDVLRSVPEKMSADARSAFLTGSVEIDAVDVRAGTITLDAVRSLMEAFHDRVRAGAWADRGTSDRWLAPRLHFALRLTRAEASDRGLWQWLALQTPDYVVWRWKDDEGVVADNRWWGEIHKQALARLWWGAEVFRNGSDYGPAVQAFVLQDLPNSYLHRTLVRCRSLALAIVDELVPADGKPRSSDEVNDLARVLNLAAAGCPPEVETGYQRDDSQAYASWAASVPSTPPSWDPLPLGPPAADTTSASRTGAKVIVERGAAYANLSER